jgi:hypothetical protein
MSLSEAIFRPNYATSLRSDRPALGGALGQRRNSWKKAMKAIARLKFPGNIKQSAAAAPKLGPRQHPLLPARVAARRITEILKHRFTREKPRGSLTHADEQEMYKSHKPLTDAHAGTPRGPGSSHATNSGDLRRAKRVACQPSLACADALGNGFDQIGLERDAHLSSFQRRLLFARSACQC